MDIKEFEAALYELLNKVGEVLTVESGNKPIGMFYLNVRDWIVEPHFDWFPWATARQKLESAVKLFDNIRKTPWYAEIGPKHKTVFVRCSKKDANFFTHIAKYGILRRIGTSETLGPDGSEALFESK